MFRRGALVALIGMGLGLAGPARAAVLPDAPCQVIASERSEVAPLVPGVLTEVLVDRGDHVNKGQVVARLYAEVERAQVASAAARASSDATLRSRRAKLGMTERTVARNKDLQAQKVISEQDYDQVRTERDVAAIEAVVASEALAQARADLDVARASLNAREIRSPIDGVVTDRAAQPGERAGEKPLMTIQRLDRLYAEVVLPATLRNRIKPGSAVQLLFDLPELAPRTVKVSLVDPVIDPRTDMFSLRLTLENVDLAVPVGIKCRIDLEAAP